MSDVWKRQEIESPCVQICVLHPQAKICIGCYRSGEEIGQWTLYDAETRKRLIEELPSRADMLKGHRRGGRGRTKTQQSEG